MSHAPEVLIPDSEVRAMIEWFKKRVPLPEFDLVLVDEERLSKHGEVIRRPRKKPRMRLFSTGMTESTVIHELAHLLTPPPKKTAAIKTVGASGMPRFQWKPVLSHGTEFKAAQRKLLDLWLRRSESEELNGGAACLRLFI